jgi:ankyrin repeat protein
MTWNKCVCNSLLLFASRMGYNSMVKLCLKMGANINCQDKYGNTPLIISVYSKNQLLFETLIAYGADVNIKNNSDRTALGLALRNFRVDFVKTLIKAGTNLNEPNQNYLSTYINFYCMLDFGNPDQSKNSLLEAFMMFLEYGIDVNIKNSVGDTALITLLSGKPGHRNNQELLEILLSTNKVNLNCYNNAGDCAFTLAIR